MKTGDTYLIWSPSADDRHKKHLFFCLNDPSGEPPEVILVSCSSRRPDSDTSCILYPSDHSFLSRESIVIYGYGRCRRETLQRIKKSIENKIFIPQEPVSMSVINRIINGAKNSDFSPPWLLRFLRGI